MIRIVIADDQALVRDGLSAILDLEDDVEVVGVAGNGQECVDAVFRSVPDVVLMDIRMPIMDGIAATERIVAAGSRARILMLTTFDLDEYVYRAMRAGASGFLLKDAPRRTLIDAVRAVARGDSIVGPVITKRLVEHFVGRPPPDTIVTRRLATLTTREHEILRLLARGMSNREIGEFLVVSDATVKTHVATLLAKLVVRDRLQAVVLAYESGFIQPGEP